MRFQVVLLKNASKETNLPTIMELAEACKNENFVVFASRNDEDNTKYSVKLYEYINQNNPDDILYFSLKESRFERIQKYVPRTYGYSR